MLALAVVLLAGAAFQFSRFLDERSQAGENSYFYDLSERKLFVAPRTLVPPIRGINNDEPDGMRAIVISTSGDPKDKAGQRIAYLERYAQCRSDIRSARYCAGGHGAARHPYHRAKHILGASPIEAGGWPARRIFKTGSHTKIPLTTSPSSAGPISRWFNPWKR